ncbi:MULTISPECIES: uracil-DNA glycosylase family protein [Acinetobacter]|nr:MULTISPECIES: uracil-DNA glycosylase family protein [Acinetobacter]
MGIYTYSEMAATLKKLAVSKNSDLSELEDLCIAKDGDIESYYIPFDYVTPTAKVVLVGITPGKTQLINAIQSVQKSLQKGLSVQETLKMAKNEGAFSGTLRGNLVRLLDHIGLNKKLNIESTASLFNEDAHLVHTTSVLRHPVFVGKKDYSGSNPSMIKHPLMLGSIETYLKQEIHQLPNAIYIPLGPKVAQVFEMLIKQGVLDSNQVLFGLPHPSGANAERIAYFLGNKPKELLSPKTNPEILDKAKAEIIEKLEKYKI